MSLRRLLFGHALCALAGAACIAGCSSDPPPTARAYVQSQVGAGTLGSAACNVVEPNWVTIGTSATPANDGDQQSGVAVHVSCTVTANSDGSFQVNANAAVGNGSITVNGKFTTSGDQTGIHASFTRADFGRFSDNNCTVSYSLNSAMGVAAGRVWGYITCLNASDSSQHATGPDGGSVDRTCKGQGEFKFENCGQ